MNTYLTFILNVLFVSIPEEIVWVSIIFILNNRYDLLDSKRIKENLKSWIPPVLVISIYTNIFIYFIPKTYHTEMYKSLGSLILLMAIMTYILKRTDFLNKMKVYKIVIFTLISCLIMGITEMIYAPLVLYLSNTPISIINKSFYCNFLLSFPSRIFQIAFIYLILFNKKFNLKFAQIIEILNNKFTYCLITITMIITITIWMYSQAIIFNSDFILKLPLYYKLAIGNILVFLPTIFIIIIIVNQLYNYKKIYDIEKKYSNMLDDLDKKEV